MTPERVQAIYEALDKLFVELDRDPVSRGPGYLQDLISKTRGYLNQTGAYLQEINREKHNLEMELDAQEAAFEVQKSELLAEDRRVRLLPSIEDRLAMVDVLLGEERREIQRLRREVKNLGHIDKAVRHRHKELDNTMSAIRLQKQLVDAELRTGSFYGDENDTSRGSRWRKADPQLPDQDLEEDEVLRLLEEAEGALDGDASDEEVEEETEETEAEEAGEAEASPEGNGQTSEDPEPEEAEDPDVTKFLDGEGEGEFADLFDEL